ncbi:hypothetical protein SteCoe_18198 [Stentor coeruleus]|uniref:Uncharacterized protein n=1 Tax=Stentor coeruleus TaxID=5963 RepID=A0A1R2BX61_9CILI|nr:hypothetical protein SteCoe_18198 [Stentor coeruleus]
MEGDPFLDKQKIKLHCVLSALMNLLVVVMQIVSMAIKEWAHYCYFTMGLVEGKTTHDGLEDRVSGYNTYSDIHSHMCNSYKPVIDAACPDFCDNIERMKNAGIVMIVFQCISCAINIFYVILHVRMYFGKVSQHWAYYYGVWAPSAIFIIGLTFYLGISDFYGIDSTWKHKQNIKTGPGLALSYSILVLNFLPAIHSYIFTSSKLSR